MNSSQNMKKLWFDEYLKDPSQDFGKKFNELLQKINMV